MEALLLRIQFSTGKAERPKEILKAVSHKEHSSFENFCLNTYWKQNFTSCQFSQTEQTADRDLCQRKWLGQHEVFDLW